jgi:hypothetical protein
MDQVVGNLGPGERLGQALAADRVGDGELGAVGEAPRLELVGVMAAEAAQLVSVGSQPGRKRRAHEPGDASDQDPHLTDSLHI